MSKVALITDIHFSVRGGSQHFLDRYKLFFDNVFFPALVDQNIKTILILGDTWEDRKNMFINAIFQSKEMFFDKAKELGIEIISILGNHDVFYRNTNELNSMNLFKEIYDNIRIVEEFEEITIGNYKLGLMSWINKENYDRQLVNLKNTAASILLGHFEISQFEMTKGVFCEEGMKQELFNDFDQVYSGHFHIKNTDGKIKYLGNPFQTNWDDYDAERGFHIFNGNDGSLAFIENTYRNYENIHYTDSTNIKDFDYEKYRNLIVKITVHRINELKQKPYIQFCEKLKEYTYDQHVLELGELFTEDDLKEKSIDIVSTKQVIAEHISEMELADNIKNKVLRRFIELQKSSENESDKT